MHLTKMASHAREAILHINLLFCWCREGGSNPHDRKGRRILSPLRLPVPPSRPGVEFSLKSIAQPFHAAPPTLFSNTPARMSMEPVESRAWRAALAVARGQSPPAFTAIVLARSARTRHPARSAHCRPEPWHSPLAPSGPPAHATLRSLNPHAIPVSSYLIGQL